MAFLHLAPSGKFHVGFRYAGRQWKQSLNTANPQLAERARLRLEVNLRLVEEGRLDIPDGVDVAEFLLYDGKLSFVSCTTPPNNHLDATLETGASECRGRQTSVVDGADIAATRCRDGLMAHFRLTPGSGYQDPRRDGCWLGNIDTRTGAFAAASPDRGRIV